jgi:hypothetical protein
MLDRAQCVDVGDSQDQLNFSRKRDFTLAVLLKLGSDPLQLL